MTIWRLSDFPVPIWELGMRLFHTTEAPSRVTRVNLEYLWNEQTVCSLVCGYSYFIILGLVITNVIMLFLIFCWCHIVRSVVKLSLWCLLTWMVIILYIKWSIRNPCWIGKGWVLYFTEQIFSRGSLILCFNIHLLVLFRSFRKLWSTNFVNCVM